MKQIANLYTFDAAARRVSITGISIPQARLLLIVNATLGQIIYNFAAPGLGATSYQAAGNTVVTLACDTTAHSNSDQLTIFYEDGMNAEEVVMLADLNTVAGAAPAPWLKNGGGSVPVTLGGSAAGVSLAEVTGTAALTSSEVLVANAARKYLLIQNLSTATMHLSLGGVASASTLRLDGGASLCFESNNIATNAILLIGTVAGQKYYIAHA
jgi:hypothetical protein